MIGEDSAFQFDGTSSNLVQHFYNLHQRDVAAQPMKIASLPAQIREHLQEHSVTFDELPPLLQRALVWDMGYVYGDGANLVQVRVRCDRELKMSDLALPESTYRDIMDEYNCTIRSCGTDALRAEVCLSQYVLERSSCAITAEVERDFESSMWATGGDNDAVPLTYVVDHSWNEWNGENQVMAIHTALDETPWGKCPGPRQSKSSMIIPCAPLEEAGPFKYCAPRRGSLVDAWIQAFVEEKSGTSKPNVSTTPPPSAAAPMTEAKVDDTGVDVPAIIGICVGVLFIIVLVVVLIFHRRKRHQADSSLQNCQFRAVASPEPRPPRKFSPAGVFLASEKLDGTAKTSNSDPFIAVGSNVDEPDFHALLEQNAVLQRLRVPLAAIGMVSAVSKGAYGEIWLARYKDEMVAVKRLLRSRSTEIDIQAFIAEIELTASLRHPNIITFKATAWDAPSQLCMVMEYLAVGDLQSYLGSHASELSWWRDKLSLAIGLACAIEYLHARRPIVIHRDIKAKNVLLTDRMEPKLIDFGVSRDKEEETMTAGVGTPYWTAPEVLDGRRYSEKSDIYSFGVFLSELDTGMIPYADVMNTRGEKMAPLRILQSVMCGELLPKFSDKCPAQVRQLAIACLDHDPRRRPSAADVVATLRGDSYYW